MSGRDGPRIIKWVNRSPRRNFAKSAFQRREIAPRGARTTMGRAPTWKTVPRTLEVIKMAEQRRNTFSPGWIKEARGKRKGTD